MVKSFISELTNIPIDNDDMTLLTDFLFGVEYWGKYELLLLGNSMHSININSLDLLLKEVIAKSEKFADTETNYILKIDLLLNAVNNALKRKKLDYAQEYINYLNELNISSMKLIAEKILLDFFKVMINIIKKDDEAAKDKVTNIFKALEELSLEHFLLTLEVDYEYFIEIYDL